MRPSLLLKVQFPVREDQAAEDGVTSQDQQVNPASPSALTLLQSLSCFSWHHLLNSFFFFLFQAYYLCYSLLILINEASNFESLPLGQKVIEEITGYYQNMLKWEWSITLENGSPVMVNTSPELHVKWPFAFHPKYGRVSLCSHTCCPLLFQKHLHILSAELEKHIKCDIRETEKCLYRSKVCSPLGPGPVPVCLSLPTPPTEFSNLQHRGICIQGKCNT